MVRIGGNAYLHDLHALDDQREVPGNAVGDIL